MYTYLDLYLAYNYDRLLNLVDFLRENAMYQPFLDFKFESTEFINLISDHVDFIEFDQEEDTEIHDENEYYNFET